MSRDSSSVPAVCTPSHCVVCFDALLAELSAGHVSVRVNAEEVGGTFPLFVTWKKRRRASHPADAADDDADGDGYSLRGCIGTFAPSKLPRALKEYALTSALRDTRFDPIALDEVPLLACTVSLLQVQALDFEATTFRGAGSDGTERAFSATYLPDVAREQGWSKREAIESLARKAGYRGPITAAWFDSVELTRYQSTTASLTYDAYKRVATKAS